MIIENVIKKGFEELKKNNIKTALLDCELLISKAMNEKREFILFNSDLKISKKDYLDFQKLIIEEKKANQLLI